MERKTCSQCGIEKNLSEYHKDRQYLRSNCKDCHNHTKKQNYEKKRELYIQKMRSYDSSSESKLKRREREKKRKQNDPIYKMEIVYRSRLNKALSGWCRSKHTLELLGCSWEELKIHLENQFQKDMTWENHGYHGWHVDHIIPLSSAKTLGELEKLCHYTNLQPLWAKDNLKKSDRENT